MKPQTLAITAPYSPVFQKLKSLLKRKIEPSAKKPSQEGV